MSVMRVSAILVLAIVGGLARVEVRPAGQASPAASPKWATKNLRAGIIGTDTSHVPAFTATFESHPEWKIKVVAAFKGGSPDLPISANRVEGFAKTIQEKNGVEIVDSIEALLGKVDVVLLEERGRASAPGAGHARAQSRQARVHRQAAGRQPGGRAADRRSSRRRPARRSSAPRRRASIRTSPGCGTTPAWGRSRRSRRATRLNPLRVSSGPLLLRDPRRRGALRRHGHRMRQRVPQIEGDTDITTGTWKDGRVGVYHAAQAEARSSR